LSFYDFWSEEKTLNGLEWEEELRDIFLSTGIMKNDEDLI